MVAQQAPRAHTASQNMKLLNPVITKAIATVLVRNVEYCAECVRQYGHPFPATYDFGVVAYISRDGRIRLKMRIDDARAEYTVHPPTLSIGANDAAGKQVTQFTKDIAWAAAHAVCAYVDTSIDMHATLVQAALVAGISHDKVEAEVDRKASRAARRAKYEM